MSGLAGAFTCGGEPASAATLGAMLDRMAHRGPDGRATHVAGDVALGYARFATVPEDRERAQPARTASGATWIVADARIDNRRELEATLGKPGDVSDAELILAAYERWSEECPKHLLGDFAFVVYDGDRRRLFAARDHLGVRPLYYHHDARGFRFASEPHALFADPSVRRRLHQPSLGLFLSEDYLERDQTMFEDVLALPPAHAMTVGARGVSTWPYWRPDPFRETRHATDAEHAEHFRGVFREAVRCRLRAVGPVAAQVSGGMDSSSVVAETERLRESGAGLRDPALLVHASFPGRECDETRFGEAVASHWRLPLLKILPPEDPEETRPDPARLEPGLLLYAHPLEAMWRRQFDATRSRGVRVTLTGFGSDELMLRTGRECADALLRGDLKGAAATVGLDSAPLSGGAWRRLLREGVRPLVPQRTRQAWRRLRRRPPASGPRWLSPQSLGVAADVRAERQRQLAAIDAPGPALRELCFDLTHGYAFVFGNALQDPTAARGGAELRHPFYDLRLVDLLLSTPHVLRCGIHERKPLLRRAMNGDVPAVVQARPHSAAYDGWVHHVLFEQHAASVAALFEHKGPLRGSRLEELGVIEAAQARRLIDDARRDWSLIRHVANLCCLEVWLRYSFP